LIIRFMFVKDKFLWIVMWIFAGTRLRVLLS
jgi:hypothetical protein